MASLRLPTPSFVRRIAHRRGAAFSLLARLVVVVLFGAAASSSYAQIVQFPLLGGGRALDGAARFNNAPSAERPVPEVVVAPNANPQAGVHQTLIQDLTHAPDGWNSTNAAPASSSRRLNSDASRERRVPTRPNAGSADAQTRVRDTGAVSQQPARGNGIPANSKVQTKHELRTRNIAPCLLVSGGEYDFLRVIRPEQVANIAAPPQGLVVALPRKNFWIADKILAEEEKENQTKSENDGVKPDLNVRGQVANASEVGKSDEIVEEEPDDYVVFLLTNLDPDEQLMLQDARDGKWDFADLLTASLIAEGLTTRESRAHFRSRFETLLASLKAQTNNLNDELMKTQRVYDFLHKTTLVSKYDLNCSSVSASLDTGVFNCVSATVLFNCFASRVGLEVAALETTGHAKSRVKYAESYLDIETTCSSWDRLPDRVHAYSHARVNAKRIEQGTHGMAAPVEGPTTGLAERGAAPANNVLDGSSETKTETVSARTPTGRVQFKPIDFDSGTDVELASASHTQSKDRSAPSAENSVADGSVKDAKETPTANSANEMGSTTFGIDEEAPMGYSFTRTRRPMREITDVELVATIYYNVGVDHYQAGDYEGAIASYIKAVQLAPNNKTMLGNLKATLNNWAIDLATKEKRYDAAIKITELGLRIDPNFHEFKMNMPIFFRDWIEYLAKDDKWDEAARVREKYWKMFPNGK